MLYYFSVTWRNWEVCINDIGVPACRREEYKYLGEEERFP